MYSIFLIQSSSVKLEPWRARGRRSPHSRTPIQRQLCTDTRKQLEESDLLGEEQIHGRKKSSEVTPAHRLCTGRAWDPVPRSNTPRCSFRKDKHMFISRRERNSARLLTRTIVLLGFSIWQKGSHSKNLARLSGCLGMK